MKLLKKVLASAVVFAMLVSTLSTTQAIKYVYAMMNVPYSTLYASLQNDVDVDVVASATKYGQNVYGTEAEKGIRVEGVNIPVKMTNATYLRLKDKVQDENAAYYLSETLEDEPSVYANVQYIFGKYQVSRFIGEVKVVENVGATISSSSKWANYELVLADQSLGINPATLYQGVITCLDGSQYGLRDGENYWNPRNYFEVAFSTVEGTTDVKGNVRSSAHYASMEGKTITMLSFYTSEGIVEYHLENPLYVAPHANVNLGAEIVNDQLQLRNIPEDIQDALVSLYVDGRQPTYYIQNAALDALDTLTIAGLTENNKYTVSITSSNYATMKETITYSSENVPVFVKMKVDYNTYAAALGINTPNGVDSVASATRVNANSYTVEGNIEGVIVPVRMSSATYKALQLDVDVIEEPTTYLEATMVNGQVVYSKGKNSTTKVENMEATIDTSSNWGDYLVVFPKDQAIKADDYILGYFTTATNKDYVMKVGENTWNPGGIFEYAWATTEGFKDAKGWTGRSGNQNASMEGETLVSFSVVSVNGTITYQFANPLKVLPHQTSTITASFIDPTHVKVEGLARDIENVQVTIKKSGKGGTTLVANAPVQNKVVELDKAATADTTYQVVIQSSNYAASKITITTSPIVNISLRNITVVNLRSTINLQDYIHVDFLDEYTVVYESSCPKVIHVDENGLLQARHLGIASIKITVYDLDGQIINTKKVQVLSTLFYR